MYDKDGDGKLNRNEAIGYVKDLLDAAGLAKQIWVRTFSSLIFYFDHKLTVSCFFCRPQDDAVQADDPKTYFDDVVAGIYEEIAKKQKGDLELSDIIEMTSKSARLQDILNDVSERLEESWRDEMFRKYGYTEYFGISFNNFIVLTILD